MNANTTLTLLQINDTHAYLDLHTELFWSARGAEYRPAGGFGRIAAFFKSVRQEAPGQVLALDCGDTLHGTYPAVASQGEAPVPILNALNLSAMTAHWDFAYGPARLKELAGKLNFPLLAINCFKKADGELFFEPCRILEMAGLRIGIIGIANPISDRIMPPELREEVHFTLGNQELPGWITRLRQEEKVDLIVVISHIGFPQEMKLAGEVPGIDVLLSAHTHNRLWAPVRVNETLLIQSGSQGSFVGRLDLKLEGGKIVDYNHQLVVTEQSMQPDPQVQELVEAALAPQREEMELVVGEVATPLNRNTVLEATMDNLLLQALVDLTGRSLAFSNGWRYGAPITPGPVSLNDLHNIIPVNPPVSTVELSGDEIWRMLEENLEHTFACDPYDQKGGYIKRMLGARMFVKIENPKGQRIQELFVGEQPVVPDKVYPAVFVTEQGVAPKYGTYRQKLDMRAVQALQRYLSNGKAAEAELRGTVVVI